MVAAMGDSGHQALTERGYPDPHRGPKRPSQPRARSMRTGLRSPTGKRVFMGGDRGPKRAKRRVSWPRDTIKRPDPVLSHGTHDVFWETHKAGRFQEVGGGARRN